MRICFTYLIGWSQYNKYYYGRRTAKGCRPDSLFTTYFTSSLYVKEFINNYGRPDIIQIRKIFNEDYKSCENWESKVLRRIDAAKDNRFLNKRNNAGHSTSGIAPAYDKNANFIGMVDCDSLEWGNSIFGINKFKDLSNFSNSGHEENRKLAKQGKHISQIRVANGTHHFIGNGGNRNIDNIQRELIKTGKHYFKSDAHKKEVSERTKRLGKEGKLPIGQKAKCPYCEKIGQKVAMKRWHFENCKNKE